MSHGEWCGTENSAVTPTRDQTPTGMCMTGVVVYILKLLKDVNVVIVFEVFSFSWQQISELILWVVTLYTWVDMQMEATCYSKMLASVYQTA